MCKGLEIISILTNYLPFIACITIFYILLSFCHSNSMALLLGLCWHSPLCNFQTKLFWQAGQSMVAGIPFPLFKAVIRVQHPRVLLCQGCREALNCGSSQMRPWVSIPQQHLCHKCAQLWFLCWLWIWHVEFVLWVTWLSGFSSEFRAISLIVTF